MTNQFNPEDLLITTWSSTENHPVPCAKNGVKIVHLPTKLVVTVDEERTQHANKLKALAILSEKLDKLLAY
ncbi:peptide chain release factor family protein [Endozoicomonas lisbonensis]|uniref:Protein subunit release factor A n=1 Tax=Endozoicomonas lisbonensis TaxID=3120522 RepID=A0ABV2SGZ9_9GAMM